MAYFCYIHMGLFVTGNAEGCHDVRCLDFAEKEVRPAGLHLTGQGGSDATKVSRANSKQFHKDMYAYKAAHDQGVRPDQVTAVAAETALKKAEVAAHGTD